jgi:hypothetical protein
MPSSQGARADSRWLVTLALLGVPLGLVWRLLIAVANSSFPAAERAVTQDGLLGLVVAVAGLGTAIALLRRPGPAPARRGLAALVGSVLGAAMAAGTGFVVGAPSVRALGVLLVWPAVAAAVTFVVLVTMIAFGPDRSDA